MSLRSWMVPAATGGVGLLVGVLIARGPDATAGTAMSPAPTAPLQLSIEEIRRVVREEVAAQEPRTASSPAQRGSGMESDSSLATDTQQAASIRARAVLDSALARQSWTQADADAMREDAYLMTQAHRDEWLRQFSQAVNQGRLVPESDGIPF